MSRMTISLLTLALGVVLLGAGCQKIPAAQQPMSSAPSPASDADVLTDDPAGVSLDATAAFSTDDATAGIRADLDRVTVPDVDKEFEGVDRNIEGL